MTNKIPIMVIIIVFSISLSIIPAYAAIQFDQSISFNANNRIMIDHSDIITYTGATSPNPVTITGGNAGSMQINLVQIGTTNVWQKMVQFTTCTVNDPATLKYCVTNDQTITTTTIGQESSSAKISTSNTNPTFGTISTVTARTCQNDVDQDGVCDEWETGTNLRIPSTVNGNPDYVFACNPACNSSKKDIFVEIDYMNGHRPNTESIQAMKNAFASSPNGGINLHIQIDDTETGINHSLSTPFPGTSLAKGFDQIKAAHFGTPNERATGDNKIIKRQVFHYFLIAHAQPSPSSTSSGTGEFLGNDALITLGTFDGKIGSPDQQSGTLMHELGHNLNLNHGGPVTDAINCKPNYLSVMSYSHQFPTIPNRPLDYSRSVLPTLAESSLSEPNGVGASTPPGLSTIYGPPTAQTRVTGQAFDWNRDGDYSDTGVPADINYLGGTTGCGASTGQTLNGYNDWSGINLKFKDSSTTFADGASSSSTDSDEGKQCSSIPADLPEQAIAQLSANNRLCATNEITSEHVRGMRNIIIDQLTDKAKPLEESNPYLYSDIIGKYEDAKNLINNDELALAHQKLSEIDYSGIEDATIKEQLQGASNDVKSLFSHVKPEVSISRGPGASPQEAPAPEDLQAPEEAPPDDTGIMVMIAGAAAAAAIGGGAYAVSRRGSGTKVNRQ